MQKKINDNFNLRLKPSQNIHVKKALAIVLSAILFDQVSKFYVKLTMQLHQSIEITKWFHILFVENNGMAYGWEFGGGYGKLFLTFFRIIAIVALCYWMFFGIRKYANNYFIIPAAMIIGGALGNLIDSIFYGVIFNDSVQKVSELLSANGGYSTWFKGRVVDMFYFPLIDTNIPAWFPKQPSYQTTVLPDFIYHNFPWANKPFVFFRYIFNVADSLITLGVVMLLIFQKKAFENATIVKQRP